MAFDSITRGKLQRLVAACRKLLTEEFDDQLQSLYGIYAGDGRILELDKLASLDDDQRAIGALLRARIAHLHSGLTGSKTPLADAVQRVLREQAFTILNRFAALRMAEERELVLQCVADGLNSKGFQVFENVASPDLGSQYGRYRVFLDCLFDELSLDLGVLFDRFSPFGLLFPRERKLKDFLALLNDHELKSLWREDETIGWIYQYFNDEAERKRMREESSAPRNSRELAVRNQFFTPRYVVEFLTDNTLGRLWYEMTRGGTVLRHRCRYLVHRRMEIFLKEGESAPERTAVSAAEENPSQEDLLRAPVHIPHRPLKDPRTIRVLDPACGSMHFGLYAFDLFECIYDEAWDIAHGTDEALKSAPSFAPFVSYVSQFADKAAFLREVPRLIVEHNLHGIDIDPRAVQIAGLSLWLRAHRAWQRAGVKPADRPRITRSNLVCAEPMPGERELLREFVEGAFPAGEWPAFAFLLEKIFDRMTLAGEAGSLLRIEEEIRAAVAEARALAQRQSAPRQAALFAGTEPPEQEEFDLRGLTDEQFWEKAEERIYEALETYAEQAENGGGFQRRLFAADASQGFAFIDLCRKRYDVVVMNPPFGEASIESRRYLYVAIPDATQDLFAAFVSRGTELLEPQGTVGAITNRLGLVKDTLVDWRERIFFGQGGLLQTVADLGYGVLDAVVETAAYVTEKTKSAPLANAECAFFYLLDTDQKEVMLQRLLQNPDTPSSRFFRHSLESFVSLPSKRIAYWCTGGWLVRFTSLPSAHELGLVSKKGIETGKDFIMLRLAWEIPRAELIPFERWTPQSKGGPYRPIHSDIHLCFDWAKRDLLRRMSNSEMYGHAGLTYTERTTSNFAARILPEQALFSTRGPIVTHRKKSLLWGLLGFLNSSVVGFYLELFVGGGDASAPGTAARVFASTYLELLPVPRDFESVLANIGDLARKAHDLAAPFKHEEETSFMFRSLSLCCDSIRESVSRRFESYEAAVLEALDCWDRVDDLVAGAYKLTEPERRDLKSYLGRPLPTNTDFPAHRVPEVERFFANASLAADDSDEGVSSRAATKLCYRVDALYESGAARFDVSPTALAATRKQQRLLPPTLASVEAARIISYIFGSVFGRWDIRYATGERPAPELPDPFAPLSVCPPGMLQGIDGLPLSPEEGRQLHAAGQYPLDVAWDGVLVDDPEHPLDLERRVHAALHVLWQERADDLEHEACALLGVPGLREWFRRPAGFFGDHLRRYSKSRRQAPIYWPLSTASGRYALWLYYPRLTDQTLFRAVTDFVKPKLDAVTADVNRLQAKARTGTARERAELEALSDFQTELQELHDELFRVAQLPWKPNLNDGVLITASPLWKLFRLPKWQKDLKACSEELAAGDYDWAHLAYSIWPDRVRAKCKTDRSLAIGHGLEDVCEVEAPKPKAKKGRKAKSEEAMI